MTKDGLYFLPLGGSGEIGMNLNLYATAGKWLMVDLGMTFTGGDVPGCDLILPDTGFIEDARDDLLAIVLTHGHEDHIGSVPYLWRRFRKPIYATAFTMELVKNKLAEAGCLDSAELILVEPGKAYDIGPFNIEYLPLAHSIAEGNGVILKTKAGTVFHTGDWKLDEAPQIGPADPMGRLKALGKDGVLAVVGDSTNVFNPDNSGSEQIVLDTLMELVPKQKGRVVVTTFASNVARLLTMARVAEATGRHIAFLGRSMHRILDAARESGYLQDIPNFLDEDHLGDIPRDKLMVCTTGCQGEPRAALARIASGDHRTLSLSEGDTVIFSSKMIPGNEKPIATVINKLIRDGIHVIGEKQADVHVSGHPGRADLVQMYEALKPKVFIPVHGEDRHLAAHAELARELQVPEVVTPHNGTLIEIAPGPARVVDNVPTGRLVVDGTRITSIDAAEIGARRRIMHNGVLTVLLVIDEDGVMIDDPRVIAHGLPDWSTDDTLEDLVIDVVENAVERLSAREREDNDTIAEAARVAARRAMRDILAKKPQTDVLVWREEFEE